MSRKQQRNGGAQLVLARLMLRRLSEKLEQHDDDAEELEMPLNSLVRASKTAGTCIRDEKGFPKLVKVIQKYKKDKPDVVQKAVEILCNSLESLSSDYEAMKSALEMSKCDIVQEVIAIINIHLENNHKLIRSTVVFMAQLARDMVDLRMVVVEGFKSFCIKQGVLTAIASAMQHYMQDVSICEAGVYIIQWFMCATDDDVQRAVCGNTLNIAIEAAICEKQQREDAVIGLETFLENRKLGTAMYHDPVMGPLRQAYILHKDTSQTVRELQYAAIERRMDHAKRFCCMNGSCEKRLSIKQRLICTRCRSALYCSKECQVAAWKDHKKECQREGKK